MPGYEVIGEEEKTALLEIFSKSNGVMFAHGFDEKRNRIYRVRDFEKQFAQKFKVNHAQAVSSGTTALLATLKALNIGPGDEVITQCFTFVATVEAILAVGATPILTEIDKTFNMDPHDLRSKITSKTKAIIPVHMAGNPARMNELNKIAKEKGLFVIEDTAQAIGATYDNQFMGTFGDFGTFSLDFGKTITTGEGGMVITNNPDLYKAVLEYHDHGHEYNPEVGRADDTRSTWGLNYRMCELNAAVGMAQLKKLDLIVEKSRRNSQYIQKKLSTISGITFRTILPEAQDNGDALYFYFDSEADCSRALISMKTAGLGTKNVPDAMKWHFAGDWEHMFHHHPKYAKTYKNEWEFSTKLLKRTIALPILMAWDGAVLDQHTEKLLSALKLA